MLKKEIKCYSEREKVRSVKKKGGKGEGEGEILIKILVSVRLSFCPTGNHCLTAVSQKHFPL